VCGDDTFEIENPLHVPRAAEEGDAVDAAFPAEEDAAVMPVLIAPTLTLREHAETEEEAIDSELSVDEHVAVVLDDNSGANQDTVATHAIATEHE
jgi:hypothetical protein